MDDSPSPSVVANGSLNRSTRNNDAGSTSAAADGEVQKPGWKISSVEDGFSGVQIVIFGAAEVGKFCNFNGQMQSNIGDWDDCVCRNSLSEGP